MVSRHPPFLIINSDFGLCECVASWAVASWVCGELGGGELGVRRVGCGELVGGELDGGEMHRTHKRYQSSSPSTPTESHRGARQNTKKKEI